MDLTVDKQVVCLALAASAGALVGCSGRDGNLQATCGPGTTQVGAQCVANGASGSTMNAPDAASDASDSATDANGAPGAEWAVDAVETGPSAPTDGSLDGHPGADAGLASDPCDYTMTFMNCDNSCATKPSTWCPQSTCGKMVTAQVEANVVAYVRTPPAPGTDPACSASCPSGGFTFGIGLQFSSGGFVVKAPAPWQIIANSRTPFCADSLSTTGSCLYFPPNASGTVYLMTKDPNAPARNVQFDLASTNACP